MYLFQMHPYGHLARLVLKYQLKKYPFFGENWCLVYFKFHQKKEVLFFNPKCVFKSFLAEFGLSLLPRFSSKTNKYKGE